jgi:hypothetical protein
MLQGRCILAFLFSFVAWHLQMIVYAMAEDEGRQKPLEYLCVVVFLRHSSQYHHRLKRFKFSLSLFPIATSQQC